MIAASEHANASIAFDSVLEILVGPYRRSQGPGPFLGCPTASHAFGLSVEELSNWVDSTLEEIAAADEDELPLFEPRQTWEELSATWTVARDRFRETFGARVGD